MLNGAFGKPKNSSLMGEYATLLGDAVLRQRTREAEHAARIEAELASRVKSEFISNMSHELRTPLNTMIGFSKILTEHGTRRISDADIVEYAQLIQHAATHLLSVVNDILDISKMQSGRLTLDEREIALDEVLNAALAPLRITARDAGVELCVDVASNLPAVRGDARKLTQALSNIISNSIKFTLKGGTVHIAAMRLADGGVATLIRDNGVGMTDEEVRVALTPFGQVDGSRTRWREGAGLGLPIAKSLIELHGGELKMTSQKGQGTEVAIILPTIGTLPIHKARDALLGQGLAQ